MQKFWDHKNSLLKQWKVRTIFCNRMVSYRFLISNKLEQLKFILEKLLGLRNMQEKLENVSTHFCASWQCVPVLFLWRFYSPFVALYVSFHWRYQQTYHSALLICNVFHNPFGALIFCTLYKTILSLVVKTRNLKSK